jgi:hypothetical protein
VIPPRSGYFATAFLPETRPGLPRGEPLDVSFQQVDDGTAPV